MSDLSRPKRRRNVLLALSIVALLFYYYAFGSDTPSVKNLRAASQKRALTTNVSKPEVFSTGLGTTMELVLPAPRYEILGIGYHQAYNKKALSLASRFTLMPEPTTNSVAEAVRSGLLVSFVMEPRGRGTALDSSVDMAMKAGTEIKSPISGKIIGVVPYLLYGKSDDIRIDIKPDTNPDFKISIIHVNAPKVKVGQRVKAGVTPLAEVRGLGIDSQINQYLGQVVDQIHIQINSIEAEPVVENAE